MPSHSGYALNINGVQMQLLPQKAVFVNEMNSLLVSDIHLGKAETFQAFGVPISNRTNYDTLNRLLTLCQDYEPEHLFILGDLFHSPFALAEQVIESWVEFVNEINLDIHLIVGNHDRSLVDDLSNLLMYCHLDSIDIGNVRLSHEPDPLGNTDGSPANQLTTICGHVHPCIRLKTQLDDLRLPCFYLEKQANRLTLPSFGEFTGGFEVSLSSSNHAYAIAENTIVAFDSLIHS